MAAIEEPKDLKVLTVDELFGSLLSYEEWMKRYDDQLVKNAFLSKEKSNGSREFGKKGHEGQVSHGKKSEKMVKVVNVAFQSKVKLVIKVMVKSVSPSVITVRNLAILKNFIV